MKLLYFVWRSVCDLQADTDMTRVRVISRGVTDYLVETIGADWKPERFSLSVMF